MKKFIITGGAGFIGSNLVDELLKNESNKIIVFDNFSTGKLENLPVNNRNLEIINLDLTIDFKTWPIIENVDTLFHFAANADVRGGELDRNIDFVQNVLVTKSICDYSKTNNIKKVVFASSATVYGEPNTFPTPENAESIQTSIYGASKLSCEAFLEAYSEYKDFEIRIFRFVSWIGKGYSHGVIYDFCKKLKSNPKELEILGNGKQVKSYLDVEDGVRAIIELTFKDDLKHKVFNIGHDYFMNVTDLADIVCDEMKLQNVFYKFTGGERGWIGDSPIVHLNIERVKQYGWSPKITIEEGIRKTVRYLLSSDTKFFR